MIRVQQVVLPILRAALPGVSVVSWIPDVDSRTYPLVAVHRAGGPRNARRPEALSLPVVDLSAFSAEGLAEAEELYEDALEALYASVSDQTVVPGVGYLHSMKEAQGASQAPSPFPDTWMAHGIIQLGLRPV